jgi:hypothetical protein
LACKPQLKGLMKKRKYNNCHLHYPQLNSWLETKCQLHGGLEKVLPQYSGCYPTSSTFWNSYAPNLEIDYSTEPHTCAYDIPIPALNPPNLNFEAADMMAGWSMTAQGGWWLVGQNCDRYTCGQPFDEPCQASEGTCFATVSAGNSELFYTEPNALWREDFRVPEIDETCGAQILLGTVPKFCFQFAMRFEAKDYASEGKNDFFEVLVQVNDGGPMLYHHIIQVSDVGDLGDSGWQHASVELPTTRPGIPMYFGLQARVSNVGDALLDSIGYLDDIRIAPCVENGA